MIVVYVALFLLIAYWELKVVNAQSVTIGLPRQPETKRLFSGPEGAVILILALSWVGILPLLSVQLSFLIILCLIGIFKSNEKILFSVPMAAYVIFLLWECYGLTYTRMPSYGIRMILKYAYPLIFGMMCAKVVRNSDVFLYSGIWARLTGTIGIVLLIFGHGLFGHVLWYATGFCIGLIVYMVFSLFLAYHSNKPTQNIIWAVLLCLPAIWLSFRTSLYGIAVALTMFFLLKYKLRALPFVVVVAAIFVASIFYIPSIKQKMFLRPDKVTVDGFLSGDVGEDDIQTNFRKYMADHAKEDFYYGHEATGSGTGRVQTQYNEELTDTRRGGLPHNDFVVLMCDNGDVGLYLFIAAYALIFFHCLKIYHRSHNTYTRGAAMVAGASIIGIMVTMYSDNTVSYSMVTLSQPWGFYGMALGLDYRDKHREENTDPAAT